MVRASRCACRATAWHGVLYGTTVYGGSLADPYAIGYGAVFKLTPPLPGQTRWKETVLYRFRGGADGESPMATLTMDASGALYGTTLFGGRLPCPKDSSENYRCRASAFGLTV